MTNTTPTLYIIAGPNGAGKTTFAFKRLQAVSGNINFINMDEIARGLSPLLPSAAERAAAQVALQRFKHFVHLGESFSIETTLSGKTYLEYVKLAKSHGFAIHLLYFSVATPEICIERIKRRVIEGGHNVAEHLVRRRFTRSRENLAAYTKLCDIWRIYDASNGALILISEGSFETTKVL